MVKNCLLLNTFKTVMPITVASFTLACQCYYELRNFHFLSLPTLLASWQRF